MNRAIFEKMMSEKPDNASDSYVFIVDDFDLAYNIIQAGFRTVAFIRGDEFFDADEFIRYMDDINCSGTEQGNYIYVPATSLRSVNDRLSEFFEEKYLRHYEGWKLFAGKEYLRKKEAVDEIRKILSQFVSRHEKKPQSEPDLDRFHIMGKDGEPVGVMDIEIVEDILNSVPFFVLMETAFVYENGVYNEDAGGRKLKSEIQKRLYRKFVKSPTLNRIYDLLIAQPKVQKRQSDLYNFPPEWINFRNGFYDPVNEEMHDHDPKYLSINQIPHEFHSERKSEGMVIQNYLTTSLPDEVEQKMLWEYLGYCMTTDTQMQKFLVLLGEGGTGKSIIISIFQKVIGLRNCSSISLQDLNRRFYATGLFGKLLNACGDIPCRAMETIDVLKKAVGEDTLVYEKKSQDALQFRNHAKLLFSANSMPENIEEKTDAFSRRLLILEMNRKPSPEKRDPKLKSKINGEIDYAIEKAVEALKKLYSAGKFTESEHSKECIEKARKASDSVEAFVCDSIEMKDGAWISRSNLYSIYEAYCNDEGRRPVGKQKFGAVLERKGFIIKKHQGIYGFKGAAIREADFEPVGETEVPFR